MDSRAWAESVSTALVILENALLGENAELPSNRENSAAKKTIGLRKHTRRAPSDTVSDMESCYGAPVKRRRESVNNGISSVTAVANGGIAKQSTKCRKITTALSSQFARSLSMNNSASAVMSDSMDTAANMSGMESTTEESSSAVSSARIDTSTPYPSYGYVPSSSSSGSSETSPLPGSPIAYAIGSSHNKDEKFTREYRNFVAGRSLKAREKTRAGLGNPLAGGRALHTPYDTQSSMDLDAESSIPLSPDISGGHISDLNEDNKNICVFTSLLGPIQPSSMYANSEEALHAAMQQWVHSQTYDARMSAMLVDEVDQRISRLKHIVPPLLAHARGANVEGQQSLALHGEGLQEFYKTGCELASIGEWLYHRRFPFLSAIFPELQRELPSLQGIVQISHVAEDMYRLIQLNPSLHGSICDISTQYEDTVRAKRLLYREQLAQDGLAWRTLGLPVDTLLLLQVRQWFSSATEHCLTRIARVCECRANSVSAYSKEDITSDALNQCSHRGLRAAAQCANLCGSCFPTMASQVLFIISECITCTNNRFRSAERTQSKASHPLSSANIPIYRGKQLESRSLRLAQACEGVLKLLSFAKTILTMDSTLFDAQIHRNEFCTQPVFAALQALAASLVEMSWTLAEVLVAFRLEGRFLTPSGPMMLFVDVAVKFAKKITHFGGSMVVSRPHIQKHLKQMQCVLDRLDGSGTSGVASEY
ncbi:hypothetical protein H4217_003446 [Coemansia sp. RSA 1939]|nr:hypothetical protein H4217_003446 [Coemansia sp. RSA 1939]